MEIDTRTETACCWCASAEGLLRAMLPYAIRSFNQNIEQSRRLFADHGIGDVGAALQPFHDGESVAEVERECARRLVAGVTTQSVDKLIDELGAITVARALLLLRELIQRLKAHGDSADAPAC
jgi:hypothetical protein